MDFTVLLLRAASGFLWAVRKPAPVGVVAQFADQMQVQFPYPMDKLGFTVVAIGQHRTNAGGQSGSILLKMLSILVHAGFFKGVQWRCLATGKVVCRIVIDVNQGPC